MHRTQCHSDNEACVGCAYTVRAIRPNDRRTALDEYLLLSRALAHFFSGGPFPIDVGPLQHDEVDIGDSTPVRCLKNGLWLSWEDQLPFALLLGSSMSIRLKEHH